MIGTARVPRDVGPHPSLSRPVRFIHGAINQWRDVAAESGKSIPLRELAPRLRLGREIWNVQAFHLLRHRGYDVSLARTPAEDEINVIHSDDLESLSEPWRYFLVQVRADREPGFFTQAEIVQNRSTLWKDNDLFIPHWPQASLIPRAADRGSAVRNLVYMGNRWNLSPEFTSPGFLDALRQLGVEFVLREDNWWDYHDADVVLAVRSGNPFHLTVKPAAKLINAWLAGCPALLGPEAGYRELREGRLDYIEVVDTDSVLNAVQRLRRESTLFHEMVHHGRERARQYSVDAITDMWVSVLAGPIEQRFQDWQSQSAIRRRWDYTMGKVRSRIWGYQCVQGMPSNIRAAANRFRRMVALPAATHAEWHRRDPTAH